MKESYDGTWASTMDGQVTRKLTIWISVGSLKVSGTVLYEDMYDLEAHTWAEHEEVSIVDHARRTLEDGEHIKDSVECVSIHQNLHQNDNLIGCNFCGENFETQRSLMKHKKIVHSER